MNSFVSSMQKDNNMTMTENGALAMKSTYSDIVDLFGTIGALRSRETSEVERLFAKAFAEDKLLATKMSFYARNVRGGLGERTTPRVIWRYLANSQPDIMRKNIQFVPFFGRWDDLYYLLDTPVEKDVWELIRAQYERVCRSRKVSLLWQSGLRMQILKMLHLLLGVSVLLVHCICQIRIIVRRCLPFVLTLT